MVLAQGMVEARDGIEPPSKALQTFPFSFWVPRRIERRATISRCSALEFNRLEGLPIRFPWRGGLMYRCRHRSGRCNMVAILCRMRADPASTSWRRERLFYLYAPDSSKQFRIRSSDSGSIHWPQSAARHDLPWLLRARKRLIQASEMSLRCIIKSGSSIPHSRAPASEPDEFLASNNGAGSRLCCNLSLISAALLSIRGKLDRRRLSQPGAKASALHYEGSLGD
jgi:hypothetical protein